MCIRTPPPIPEIVAYLSFKDLEVDVRRQCPPWAVLKCTETFLAFGLIDENADVVVKVVFNGDFSPVITRHGFAVQVDVAHLDVEHRGIRGLLKLLETTCWCTGSEPRAKLCPITLDKQGICQFCQVVEEQKVRKSMQPVTTTTPLSSLPVPVLIQEVRNVRSKLKATEAELDYIRRKLAKETVSVSHDVREGLEQVLQSSEIQDPFLQLFWQEQKKASTRDPRGMRWHPTMIRFAIYLHFQSQRAYEALRSTGVLQLPNQSTLRDYTSFFKAGEGFQPHVFADLRKRGSILPPEKRFCALMLDEMSVRADLVYDRRGGTVVGFTNPMTWNFKVDSEKSPASHVLVFMVVGINNTIKAAIGHFATRSATADVLYPLLWQAIFFLEENGLKAISVTSDKAAANQRLFRLHGDGKVVHQTANHFSKDDRKVFFISDPPHLIKTIRNNMELSKSGGSRCLWRNGQHIWWTHIFKVFMDDATNVLRRTKLREDHVHLTPQSRMSVRLAAQVLSRTVGLVLKNYYGSEVQETASFILKCDRFFDCLNVRSMDEHKAKRKDDLAPYRSMDDPRFKFLEDFVLDLDEWKREIEEREGFTRTEKDKMFLSSQTYEGIVTTVRGFVACCKSLLSQGVEYVLSNKFCQDPLEQHFGRHRGLGRRSRNPSVYEFGHQDNKLRMQRSLAFQFRPKGNTSEQGRESIDVDHSPLPKIKRH